MHAPEVPGLDALIRGLALLYDDDRRLLDAAEPLFDGLYEYCRLSAMRDSL